MKLQTAFFTIIIITIAMAALLFYINKKLREFDPLSEPKGIVLLTIMYAEMIDNLVKGAAGQAVQNMNLMFGIDERTGLMMPPSFL